MATVVVTRTAAASLERLISSHALPEDTTERVKRSLSILGRFPMAGRALERTAFGERRYLLGPWRWMVIVYEYDGESDQVAIVLIEDGRTSSAAANFRA